MQVQNHIHLSRTLGGSPENAPDIKWKVRADGWLPVPTIIGSINRSLTGKLVKHRLRDAGQVVKLMDYKYILRVSEYWGMTQQERLAALLDMHGQEVYLVDVLHMGDNLDHTTSVKSMYLHVISDIAGINVALNPLYVTIELTDDTL